MKDGFDVTDFIVGGGTAEALAEKIGNAPEYVPEPDDADDATPKGQRNAGEDAAEPVTDDDDDDEQWEAVDDDDTSAAPPPTTGKRTPWAERAKRTDLGNAILFADQHADVVRYATGLDWHVWDGMRWKPDATAEVERKAKRTVKRLLREAIKEKDADEQKKKVAHALRSQSASAIANLLKLAKSELPLRVEANVFDHDPWVFNTKTSTIDLRTGVAHAHRPEDLLTKVAGAPWDPHATCPQWDAFLTKIFAGNAEKIAFLQRCAGYSLTGSTREQVLIINHGDGDNGKSVLLETLLYVWGDYALPSNFALLAADRDRSGPSSELARLRGARLVTAIESGEGKAFDETVLKQLTGSDTLTVRFLHKEFFKLTPEFKLWLATNHLPKIKGTDHAIWRRIRLIPFTVKITEEEKDKDLTDKLKAEAAGILAWCLKGAAAYLKDGLQPPPEVLGATAEYREQEDVLTAFFAEHVIIDATASESSGKLYERYKRWAEESSEKVITTTMFGRKLNARNHVIDPESTHSGTKRVGLKLRPLPPVTTDANAKADQAEADSAALLNNAHDSHEEPDEQTSVLL